MGKHVHRNIRVDDLAAEVLARRARSRAKRTGETFEAALEAILKTEAGRQLEESRDEPRRGESEVLPRERAGKRPDPKSGDDGGSQG